jgi:hypothetical protein
MLEAPRERGSRREHARVSKFVLLAQVEALGSSLIGAALLSAALLVACGDDGDTPAADAGLITGQPGGATAVPGMPGGTTSVAPTGGGTPTVPVAPAMTAGTAGVPGLAGGTTPPANVGGAAAGGATAATGGGATAATGGAAGGAAAGAGGTGGVPTPTFLDGDPNGDPSKPVVSVPSIACASAGGGALGGLGGLGGLGVPVPGSANTKIGGRDVILSYPCNKREGAHVTFILNLHGTMSDEGLKFYQHGYFAAHTLATSHNLIVATPKSVVSQWGNGDNGVDRPHLFEVIDWVYANLGTKFKIAGLWVAGHSWGSMFAKTFACDEKLNGRVRGVIGQSGGATGVGGRGFGGLTGGAAGGGASTAGCADRVSQIHTNGDQEGGESGVPDQTAAATKHGCKAKVGPKDIGNMQMVSEWPECSPGWTHFNVVMGGHAHTTPINPEVVKYIVEAIKKTEKR